MTAQQTLLGNGVEAPLIKLDLGCGGKKREGYIGLDAIKFDGVDHILNLGKDPWPFINDSVDEASSSHFLEHLTAVERIHFVNELYRVLKVGAKFELIVPHWGSCRAYGDPTHQWPPISEFYFYYMDKKWRDENAPHTDVEHWKDGFACDFAVTWGYNIHPELGTRSQEFQQFAVNFYRESILEIHASFVKR